MKIKYNDKSFQKETLNLIEESNTIITDYQSRNYSLTLRQLYYQLVKSLIIPNSNKSYAKLGNIIKNGRDAGLIDWEVIEDRTRQAKELPTWETPKEILRSVLNQYRINKWASQKYQPSVWVEKEALADIIQKACEYEDIQVKHLSCRGFMSASTIWREARKIKELVEDSKTPIVIHLGDHDPSGIDMTRDNINRLEKYSGYSSYYDFEFNRIALNYDQIEEYNPPPNPAKHKDSRYLSYVEKFGNSSWELDALDPDILVNMITSEVSKYKDDKKWGERRKEEEKNRKVLKKLYNNWADIKEIVKEISNE